MAFVSWVNGTTLNASQLTSAFGNGGWTTYTPTLTNLTLGNGSMSASYMQIGKTVFVSIKFTLGSTSAVGSGPLFSLPVTANARYLATQIIGNATFIDTGVTTYPGVSRLASTTTAGPLALNAAGTYLATTGVASGVPFTFGSTDVLMIEIEYEAA